MPVPGRRAVRTAAARGAFPHVSPIVLTIMSDLRNTLRRTGRVARVARRLGGVAALAVGVLAAACADAPSAPQLSVAAPPSLAKAGAHKTGRFGASDTLAAPVVAQGLLRTTPLRAPVTATFEVTRRGGHFVLPGTGLSFQVPPGAVTDLSMTITVTARAGDVVAYEFGPHGAQFKKALEMRQDLRGTNWSRQLAPTFQVGYFSRASDLDVAKKSALVREAIPVGVNAAGQHLDFDVVHFSGYMVSWGFCDEDEDRGRGR